MGELFRSENFCLIELIVPSNIVYEAVGLTGELGWLQYKDLNSDVSQFQRNFVREIRKCEDLERILKHFAMAMESHKLCRNSDLLIDLDAEEKYAFPLLYEIDELEQRLYDLEKTLKQAEENEQSLLEELTNLQEFQSVLEGSFLFLSGTERIFLPSALYCFPDNKCDSGSPALRFGCIAGVIELSKKTSFERLLWRICRGSAFLRICNSQSVNFAAYYSHRSFLQDCPSAGRSSEERLCSVFPGHFTWRENPPRL
jgi:V-type H+-transporting ATPase subunit a